MVKEKPRSTPSRKYKAWDRERNVQAEPEPEPEQEFSSIAERIKSRSKQTQEYQPKPFDEENQQKFPSTQVQDPGRLENDLQKSSEQMRNRLQNLKNQ